MKASKVFVIRCLLGLVFIIGGIGAVFFVDWDKGEQEEAAPVRPLKMFRVGEPLSNPIRKYPGSITAIEKVTLAFQVDGPLIELPIRKGQDVKKGDLLARIDPRDFENRLAAAKAEREQAFTQLQRVTRASQSGAVSQTDLTNAQAAYEQAQANLEIAKKALEDTRLPAPFDGVIANIFVDNYENVQAKQEIVTIQKSSTLLIVVNVPEERIVRIRKGAATNRFTAVFDSLPDREFDVQVYEYALEADPATQTYLITFSMPAPEDVTLLPGMTATIWEHSPVSEQGKIILVPIDAVPVDEKGQYYVWKVRKENDDVFSVIRQHVEVGTVEGDSIQILSGLAEGEMIAANGAHTLQEGQKVREFMPKQEEAKL